MHYLVVVEDGGDGDVALQLAAHRPQQQDWQDGVHAGHHGIATHLVYVVCVCILLLILLFSSSQVQVVVHHDHLVHSAGQASGKSFLVCTITLQPR